jgi:hypothetical protein
VSASAAVRRRRVAVLRDAEAPQIDPADGDGKFA